MTDCYSFHSGTLPLLVSVPHDGRQLPAEISARMSAAGRSLPDTDWHVARLYEFVKGLGASMIVANYSRYIVDLNRPADDSVLYEGQLVTGLCPTQTFDGEAIYAEKIAIDFDNRIQTYWRPYHDKIREVLAGFRESHGFALLWDAHSIASRVPTLFDGELRVLNLGTWDGRSCDRTIANALMQVAQESRYDAVFNARFKGGHYAPLRRPQGKCARGATRDRTARVSERGDQGLRHDKSVAITRHIAMFSRDFYKGCQNAPIMRA